MAEFERLDEVALLATAANGTSARAASARFDRRRRRLVLGLTSGLDVAFDPRRVPGLAAASDEDLADIAVEGIGSTIRFRRIDADFTVARLLELFLGSDSAAA